MNASDIIKKNRNQMIFAWYWDKALFGTKPSGATAFDIQIQKTEGGDPSLERVVPTILPSSYSLDTCILSALDDLMASVASRNLGPTRTSRILYLWFHSIATAYNWVSSTAAISGTKDNWNWSTKFPLTSNSTDLFIWMNVVLVKIMPVFISGYNTSELNRRLLECFNWDMDRLNTESARVQTTGNFLEWHSLWNTWYTVRQNDGSIQAAVIPPDASLPNGSRTLEVSTTTDNPNTFAEPSKWVPLRINGSKKNYLTYGWDDVASTILTAEQESSILDSTQTFFPGNATSYNDGSARAIEIAEIVTITANLTDTQKMIAEFWAGGPGTVSPPGMFFWFWRYFMSCSFTIESKSWNSFFYSGLELAIHLFETSRLVWNLKKSNIQARPIQEIRRMYRGQTLTKWDGTPIQGEAWTPYQETNFVTPPFPDFPSGHSAFSQSFANVMSKWFGSTLPNYTLSLTNMNLISPVFTEPQSSVFGTFSIPAKGSLIQGGLVPSNTLTLSYSTWQEMADDAGLSRKYGGIHATSAHTSSQALANELHDILETSWNISKN